MKRSSKNREVGENDVTYLGPGLIIWPRTGYREVLLAATARDCGTMAGAGRGATGVSCRTPDDEFRRFEAANQRIWQLPQSVAKRFSLQRASMRRKIASTLKECQLTEANGWMLTAEALISWMTGTGIAVNARQRWRRLPVGDNLRFVDAHSIAELRARYPEWRAHSLAPASIIDAVPSLTSISDKSLDYIVGYHVLMDAKNVSQAFDSAARILKYGGTLVIPVPDAHYISDAGLETMFIIEALKRFGEDIENDTLLQIDSLARTVARISVSQRAVFDLELIGRFGLENIIIFRRKRDTFVLKTGDLVEREGAVYVVDGSEIRYVPSWETLERIKEGNHILPLNKDEYSQLTIGVPFVDADIPHILHAKRVNDK